jgi:hypothetical protein
MKKILVLSCFGLLLFAGAYGQVPIDSRTTPINRDDAINKSDYAFEGVIVKTSTYVRDYKNTISDIVRITKVYRGNLKPGTVEIVNYTFFAIPRERDIYSPALSGEHKLDTTGTFGIFFCRVAKELPYNAAFNIDVVDNKVLLSDYHNDFDGDALDRTFRTGKEYYGALGEFSSKAEVYRKLRKYPNLKIPDYAEPDPAVPEDTKAKPEHQYSKHEQDSLVRAYHPELFDATGKYLDYKHRIKKVKNDSIKGTDDAIANK